MIATSGFLTALQCTKFVFRWGSATGPAGELTALPRPLAGLRATLKGKGTPPLMQIPEFGFGLV